MKTHRHGIIHLVISIGHVGKDLVDLALFLLFRHCLRAEMSCPVCTCQSEHSVSINDPTQHIFLKKKQFKFGYVMGRRAMSKT